MQRKLYFRDYSFQVDTKWLPLFNGDINFVIALSEMISSLVENNKDISSEISEENLTNNPKAPTLEKIIDLDDGDN